MVGRIYAYTLTEGDAEAINQRRGDAASKNAGARQEGFVVHVGNAVAEGHKFPCLVVREWSPGMSNLQVFLDGNDTYWATSRRESDTGEPGTYMAAVVTYEEPA